MKTIFIHGSGHKSTSWNETISHMEDNRDILCPDLSAILNGKEACYKIYILHSKNIVIIMTDK